MVFPRKTFLEKEDYNDCFYVSNRKIMQNQNHKTVDCPDWVRPSTTPARIGIWNGASHEIDLFP